MRISGKEAPRAHVRPLCNYVILGRIINMLTANAESDTVSPLSALPLKLGGGTR